MIDYREGRLGTKVGVSLIEKCPECGQKGLRRRYRSKGHDVVIHTADDGPFALHVREKCWVKEKATPPQ